MKTIAELTDLEANRRLTELLGFCWHDYEEFASGKDGLASWKTICKKCNQNINDFKSGRTPYQIIHNNKPYATSYDAIIPMIHKLSDMQMIYFFKSLDNKVAVWTLRATPRQLLNAVIEVLKQEKNHE